MRKILKTDKEAKGIRTPITFDTDKRLKGGLETSHSGLTGKTSKMSRSQKKQKIDSPTSATSYDAPTPAKSIRTGASRNIHPRFANPSEDARSTISSRRLDINSRSNQGEVISEQRSEDEALQPDLVDQRSLDYMSEEVVQVVEELVEQTCTLRKRLREMLAQYQTRLCQCAGKQWECCEQEGPYCGYATGSAYQPDSESNRSRSRRILRDSSGYESTADRREMFMERTTTEVPAPYTAPATYNTQMAYNTQTAYNPAAAYCTCRSSCLCDQRRTTHHEPEICTGGVECPCSAQRREPIRQGSQRMVESGYRSAPEMMQTYRVKAGGPTCCEAEEELKRKLNDAQNEIADLKAVVKSFVNCQCVKHVASHTKSKISEKSATRLRSGGGDVNPKNPEDSPPKSNNGSESDVVTELQKSETKAEKSNSLKLSETKIGPSVREVNTIKQNDVVYSPEGRVIKTVEKVQRTEIVEGKNKPDNDTSTDITTNETEAKSKAPANKKMNDKQSHRNKMKTNDSPNIAHKKIASKKSTEALITSTQSSNISLGKSPSDMNLARSIRYRNESKTKFHDGKEKHSHRRSRTRTRKSSKRRKSYIIDSTPSSEDTQARSRHGKRLTSNDNNYNNEEYIIREYIYPKGGRKQKSPAPRKLPSPTYISETPVCNGRNNCHKVSLVGCKFTDRLHSPADALNLGGKADSYFIEVLPKKSHSFNGIASPSYHQHHHNVYNHHPQRRPSNYNVIDAHKHNPIMYPSPNDRHQPDLRAYQHKPPPERNTNLYQPTNRIFQTYSYQPTNIDIGTNFAKSTSIATKDTAASKEPLDLTVQSVNIDQIPQIIRQLGGKRTAKEFFISVLPGKKLSKNLRVNVIDKESGNLLGYFFVEENDFHKARASGIFDNYLSLFVLNSLASFTDFRNGVNPKVLNDYNCFGPTVTH
ncbi:uncharacterized protein LOC119660344 isoform X2 [Hermetia illucens]|uniref:uncharacterized protein LOC119660344 isoform X2 n=1 Tax=Hermetia illucens TaxID=343691 RepID=UPI0018CC5319|nr:uncharacterized protein LOC119660344 isoform X2 [Hermetia illucens]